MYHEEDGTILSQKEDVESGWPSLLRSGAQTKSPFTTHGHLQVDILKSQFLKLTDGVQGYSNADAVPQCSHHGVPQHCAHVLEEGPGGHKVSAVQDNWWEHVDEENVGTEDSGRLLFYRVHDGANDEADTNKEAGLWDPDGDLVVNVET